MSGGLKKKGRVACPDGLLLIVVFCFIFSESVGAYLNDEKGAGGLSYSKLSLEGLRQEIVRLAADIQALEASVGSLEEQIHQLELKARELQEALSHQRGKMQQGMETFVALSRSSPLVKLLSPREDPNTLARSGLALRLAVPLLKDREQMVSKEYRELQDVRGGLFQKKEELGEKKRELMMKRGELSRLYAEKSQKIGAVNQIDFPQKDLIAKNVEELVAYVRLKKKGRGALNKVQGNMTLRPPVRGQMLTVYDKKKIYLPTQGAVIETRPGVLVTAPVKGRIIFAGSFRHFGNLLIIQSQDNFHIILSGLGKIDVATGQEIFSGEPVGQMVGEFRRLGLEIRKGSRVKDPTPWVMEWSR